MDKYDKMIFDLKLELDTLLHKLDYIYPADINTITICTKELSRIADNFNEGCYHANN